MQVFISYKSEDEAYAKELSGYIQSWNFTYWLFIEHIGAGQNWDDAVHRGLQTSDVVIGLLTSKAIDHESGENVLDEWGWAKANHKPLILLRLGEVSNYDISQRYGRIEYIDLITDKLGGIEKLKSTLQKIAADLPNKNIVGANETANAHNAHKSLKRKSKIRRLIVGAFVLIVVTTTLLLIGNGCNPIPTPTKTSEPTLTPEATSTSSFTPISTYTATPIYTNTILPTFTVTKSETSTSTNTPLPPTSTFTLTVTRSMSPTPSSTIVPSASNTSSPTSSYTPESSVTPTPSCSGQIISYGAMEFNVVHSAPNNESPLRDPVQAGISVRILGQVKQPPVNTIYTWYQIADSSGKELGWLVSDYIVLSASCPR